jgi:hypothetical protein
VYQRYVLNGDGPDLASRGITDGAGYERAFLTQDLPISGFAFVALTVGGALIGGAARTFAPRPTSLPLPSSARGAAATAASDDDLLSTGESWDAAR